MLKIRNLEAGYGQLRVLKNISMHVKAGEIVAIIGANGAGKTTLLAAIAGLIRATSGEIHFLGEDISRLAAAKIPGRGCVMVPEGRKKRRSCPGCWNINTSCFPSSANEDCNLPAPFPAGNSRCWQWVGP